MHIKHTPAAIEDTLNITNHPPNVGRNPGDTKGQGHITTISVAHIERFSDSHQTSGNDAHIEINIQNAEEKTSTIKPISETAGTAIDVINLANNVISQFDTINSTYLEPLHIFNTVVNSIANVCAPLADVIFRLKVTFRSIHTLSWRWLY